ncbi:hypothetical protein ASPZODRAFT_137549 [Penicilliopsis zonata CBS 506.65]|uniref:Uncharacterized protein n=1 Tax=Penicilliopsis zonata CBS 506.65 TaxID=1073090 RepID=A0A1L9S4F2_9EURO|nr:hypothetical protein ASPZODRAFT_137549 [Penicilliopsis zonata CBS 506.65]OJJ42046.1 hypothetical protein ASPZODRAFT_137549 [Penicilliopsis zonata CBS 506.65]
MNTLDLRPYLSGLEHIIIVDEISSAHASPLHEHIILACQGKFHLPPQTRSFSPEQIYATIMELCAIWAHGRPLGRKLYHALWDRISDGAFANSEQGYFTQLVISLKQEVYVCYDMQQLLPIEEHIPVHSAILDALDLIYDGTLGLVLWKARFCLENFDMISVEGSAVYLLQLFFNPRPMPMGYIERTHRITGKFTSAIC